MLWVVLLGFLTSSLLSILANHNQASKIWLDRLKKNPIHSVKIIRAERLTSTTTSQRKKNLEENGQYCFINWARHRQSS